VLRAASITAGVVLASGCGASTLRLEIAPTIDGEGHAGVESMVSIGVGMPLDLSRRSHHYVQAQGSLGGGLDGRTKDGMFMTAASVDYIYWAEPSLDIRAGARFAYRKLPESSGAPNVFGLGGRLAILPVVVGDTSNWIVAHFCLGPELRIESLWSDPAGAERSLFSLPLVGELTLLAAGD
jgi:hypothetical protein